MKRHTWLAMQPFEQGTGTAGGALRGGLRLTGAPRKPAQTGRRAVGALDGGPSPAGTVDLGPSLGASQGRGFGQPHRTKDLRRGEVGPTRYRGGFRWGPWRPEDLSSRTCLGFLPKMRLRVSLGPASAQSRHMDGWPGRRPLPVQVLDSGAHPHARSNHAKSKQREVARAADQCDSRTP